MKNEREDFPDLLSPMLVKELRQGMRTRMFVLAFVVLQVVMAFVMSLKAIEYASDPDAFKIKDLNGIFWTLCGLLLLLVMPLRGVVALSNEEKARTLELIFLTRLTSWRIVLGKWASLMFQSLLFTLAVLPYAVLRYFFGNVNLVEDLQMLALLLWFSAFMTSVAVGISGFSGFFKGAMLVLSGLFGMGGFGLLIEFFTGSGSGMRVTFSGGSDWLSWAVFIFDSVLIGLYFLELAASQIAPDAENHFGRKRVLALLSLLLAAVLAFCGAESGLTLGQYLLGAIALGVCCAEALCSARPLMQAHVDAFANRGQLASLIGRFFYPGWPSGAAFTFLSAALLAGILCFLPLLDAADKLRVGTAILAAASALLTPLVIFSLVMKRWRQSFGPFFVVQVAFMVVAVFASFSAGFVKQRLPILVLCPLPPSSFWAVIFHAVREEELGLFLCSSGIAALGIFLLLFFWSRPFWKRIGEMEILSRVRKAGAYSNPETLPEKGAAEPEGGR